MKSQQNHEELTETVLTLLSQLCGDIPRATKKKVNNLTDDELLSIKDSLYYFLKENSSLSNYKLRGHKTYLFQGR